MKSQGPYKTKTPKSEGVLGQGEGQVYNFTDTSWRLEKHGRCLMGCVTQYVVHRQKTGSCLCSLKLTIVSILEIWTDANVFVLCLCRPLVWKLKLAKNHHVPVTSLAFKFLKNQKNLKLFQTICILLWKEISCIACIII